jgi:hypothetical protein
MPRGCPEGHRGMPGSIGLDKSDYEIISKALVYYESDPTLTVVERKAVFVMEHLVDNIISWNKLNAKINLLDQQVLENTKNPIK